ncbi:MULTISPECIES: sigma-70 RNA polymerase sigma factor region 4 domain-containing protein [Gemella]|uniref:sigma-70 family RNA polymerase sigma factor n=1 Tax=Gemella TaxID=1378 RepID=UPI00076805C0|nr:MULTISPECIES: sigma-70 family RNA polymerase sigma factor [Gemella]AME08794.1 hypothetical protein AXE85_00585 [Gemella sp. oral taxon 928]AXI26365.1 sigma-70 family RNA polymerase sigma factor [Gemella sp. ND 6198]
MTKYIYVNKEKVIVEDDVYKALKKILNREYYLFKENIRHGLINMESFDSENQNGIELLKATTPSPYDNLERKIILQALRHALLKLTGNERRLIYYLFFAEYSLRAVAKKEKTNAMDIKRRRDKILQKLKVFLKNYKIFVTE